jgi:PAS domain S-box-containing protein
VANVPGVRSDDTPRLLLGRLAFDRAPVALSLLDVDGNQLDANEAFVELLGLDPADLPEQSAVAITHPDDRDRTRDYLGRLASGELDEMVTDKQYVRPDGSTFPGRLIARALRGPDGEVVAMLGLIVDRTEQEELDRVQRELAAETAVARVAAETAHELNNLLAAMQLQLDLADDTVHAGALRDLLDRAARLGAQLLERSGERLRPTVPTVPMDGSDDRPIVLVVDDEPTLLDTVAQILSRRGYVVHVASNGVEALDVADRTPFEFLVTDLSMPLMDGVTLAEELRSRRPDLPVLFITGHAGADLSRRLPDDATVLRKPFRALELVQSIERLSQGAA